MTIIKAGDIFKTQEGCECAVVEYRGWDDVLIRYADRNAFECSVRAEHLRSGKVKNPYHPSYLGIGHLGVGRFSSESESFAKWRSMLRRCYCDKYQDKQPTYAGCSSVPEWHNLQGFSEWIVSQPGWGELGWELDKDLLVLGNKIYGPEACVLLPKRINVMICSPRDRGGIPAGVFFDDRNGKYLAYCNDEDGKRKSLGYFGCVDDAFDSYKPFKERVIKLIANRHREQLHPHAFDALMRYEVQR